MCRLRVKAVKGGVGLCFISQCPFNIALLISVSSSATEKGQWTTTWTPSDSTAHTDSTIHLKTNHRNYTDKWILDSCAFISKKNKNNPQIS